MQAEAYYYTGEAYLAQGLFDKALVPYQQAIDVENSYAPTYVGLGKAYIFFGNCTDAISVFSQALVLNPNDAEAQEGLDACTDE